jgi:hypothetical protein
MAPRRNLLTMMLFLLAGMACNKQQAPAPVSTVLPSDRVAPTPVGTTQNVLQKTFTLNRSTEFEFQIPPHAAMPHLHGIFESFAGQMHGASDESANIDFLILNQEEHDDYANNRSSETMFAVEASHNQAVNFDLPASLNQPVKYYLVFRNSEGSKSSKVIEANFRIDY